MKPGSAKPASEILSSTGLGLKRRTSHRVGRANVIAAIITLLGGGAGQRSWVGRLIRRRPVCERGRRSIKTLSGK